MINELTLLSLCILVFPKYSIVSKHYYVSRKKNQRYYSKVKRKKKQKPLFIKSISIIYKHPVHKAHKVFHSRKASYIKSFKIRPNERCEFHSVCTLFQAIPILKYIHICICCICIKKPWHYLWDEEVRGPVTQWTEMGATPILKS